MGGFIRRWIASLGLSDIRPASTPSTLDLFHPSTGKDAAPCDSVLFGHIIGVLIYILKNRHDIRKETTHLSSKRIKPTVGDLRKALRVIAYLKLTPTLGPTYYTTEGAILHAHIDGSHGVHADGRSQGAIVLSIGRTSAPFLTRAYRQTSCVSVSPMETEYVVMSDAGKLIVPFRRFLNDIGFPQIAPTRIAEDNIPAINLATAPAITGRSRHIFVRHHYIRDLIRLKIVELYHCSTKLQSADLLTKPKGPTEFWPACQRLLNTTFDPLFST